MESVLPVCDKPYHKIKENMPLGKELENMWNYPLHQFYSYAVNNLNKPLAVERMWPTYTIFYEQTKLNYEMYALKF